MPVGKGSFLGSPYVGVYLKASERFAIAPLSISNSQLHTIEHLLDVKVFRTSIGDMEIAGALVAMNSHGILVAPQVNEAELSVLREAGRVAIVRSRLNAIGNNVLVNDSGAIVHPDFLDREKEEMARALRVDVVSATIAGEGTVSKTAVATNKGVVVHPGASQKEIRLIEDVMKVPVHRSTANFGVPLVGACLVANSRGILAGDPTTPVELYHIEEGLSVYD